MLTKFLGNFRIGASVGAGRLRAGAEERRGSGADASRAAAQFVGRHSVAEGAFSIAVRLLVAFVVDDGRVRVTLFATFRLGSALCHQIRQTFAHVAGKMRGLLGRKLAQQLLALVGGRELLLGGVVVGGGQDPVQLVVVLGIVDFRLGRFSFGTCPGRLHRLAASGAQIPRLEVGVAVAQSAVRVRVRGAFIFVRSRN